MTNLKLGSTLVLCIYAEMNAVSNIEILLQYIKSGSFKFMLFLEFVTFSWKNILFTTH